MKFLISFLISALALGFSAVYIAPFVLNAISRFLPASVKTYVPATAVPSVSTNTVIQATVFGAVLVAVLIVMRKVGIRTREA